MADIAITESTSWLSSDGRLLAPVEVADTFATRRRGLLGRTGLDGALLIRPTKSVHTFGMGFPIDVAFCDRDLVVLRTTTLVPNRVSRFVHSAHAVIEAQAGNLDAWGIGVGTALDIVEVPA